MQSLHELASASVSHFRQHAFRSERPGVLRAFAANATTLPAIRKWFVSDHGPENAHVNRLDRVHLGQYGNLQVPIELSVFSDSTFKKLNQFHRAEVSLSHFLELMERERNDHGLQDSLSRVYLAQCPLTSLPESLREDVPVPDLVKHSGRGDVYDSSIWIGHAPTYTTHHKDPNPNLFVQMAGHKVIRLFEPSLGLSVFHEAQRRIGKSSSASIRGDDMMQGDEREALESLVWSTSENFEGEHFETMLSPGDALFIPKGWWHSVRSHGEGLIGSVS